MRYGEGVRGIEKEGGDKGVTVVVRERMYMCMDGCMFVGRFGYIPQYNW